MPTRQIGDAAAADAIYRKYHKHYHGEVQGCCLLIADEIRQAVGGVVVAGEIRLYGNTQRRTHWWVNKDGAILDPMGDDLLMDPRDYPERVEVHRDAREFASILRDYEQWRVFDLDHLRRVLKSRNIPEDCYALNEAGRGDCIEIDGDADEWHVVLNKDEVRTVICNSTTEDIACRTLLREITSLACSKTPTARTFA